MASDPEPIPADLTFAATDDLIGELLRRYRACVVVFEREAKTSADGSERIIHYSGGLSACIGLAERARVYLMCRAEGDDGDEEEG